MFLYGFYVVYTYFAMALTRDYYRPLVFLLDIWEEDKF